MTNILVTGGAGFIGSVVVDELIRNDYGVVVLDNLARGHRFAVNKYAKFINVDITNKEILYYAFKDNNVNAVIHLAAETVVEKSMTDPKAYFKNNIVGGLNLLDTMLLFGVRKIIFSSSATVYGYSDSKPLKETTRLKPISAYGESKLMFEKILKWYWVAYGLKYISFRYFNVAGATELRGQDHTPETSIVPCILKAVLNNQPVNLYGTDYPTKDGTCVRDYLHVSDIAKAHVLALDKIDSCPYHVFNLSSVGGYSVIDVINSACRVVNKDLEIKVCPRREGDSAILIADSSLARKELGWNPEYTSMDDIIKTAWEWQKKYPNGYEK
jgi:UDP-glucose 4-epimerase